MSSSSDNAEESCGSDIEEIRQRGNRAYKKKKYKKAARFYSAGIDIDKSVPALWSNRAMTYAAQELWQRCEDDARKTLELDESHVKARYHLVKSLIRLKKFDEAITVGEARPQGIEEIVQEACVLNARSKVTENAGLPEEEYEELKEQFSTYYQRANEQYKAQKLEEAITSFQNAISVGTNLGKKEGKDDLMNCYALLARCFMIIKKPGPAGIVFTMLRQLQEKFLGIESGRKTIAATMNNIAICARQLGKCEEALKILSEAYAMMTKADERIEDSSVANILNNIGMCQMQLGRYKEAQEAYQRSLDVNKNLYYEDHATVGLDYLCLGRAYSKTDEKKSEECYARFFSIYDKRPMSELVKESHQIPTPDKLQQIKDQAKIEFERLKAPKEIDIPA